MKRFIKQSLSALSIITLTAATLSLPVWAGSPDTGDARGQMIGWVMIALGLSVVVLIVVGIASNKKRRRK